MAEQEQTGGTMNCGVVSELLESYHAGKLNSRAEQSVQEHLATCAACSVRLSSLERQSKATGEGLAFGSDKAAGDDGVDSASWWGGAPKIAVLAIALAIVVVPGSIWFATSRMRATPVPILGDDDAAIAALRRVGDDETHAFEFSLDRPTDLRVYALGEGMSGEMYDYGWILDAENRRVVWSMEYSDTRPAGGADKNRMVDDVVSLGPGKYVLQYQTDDSHSYDDWNADPPRDKDAWGITLSVAEGRRPATRRPPRPERARGQLAEVIAEATAEAMEVARIATAEAARATRAEVAREIRRIRRDADVVAQLTGVEDDADLREPFTLEDDSRVLVYALGEATDGEMHDFAWIEDARSGRAVWRMTYEETAHAGGAEKNRLIDDIIRLPAGEYVLRYRSDDSHSFQRWNSAAPRDAEGYGVTLYLVDGR